MISLLKKGVYAVRARLQDRSDTEHEQALVRLVVGTVLFVYLIPKALTETGGLEEINHQFLAVMVSFIVVSLGIFTSILIDRNASRVRRLLGAIVDSSAVTYFMCETDAYGITLFLVYVWVTLGNGFRYGPFYLMFSLAMNVVGFSIVLWVSPFWANYFGAGIGMMVGMIALSLYVLSLVKRMFDALSRAEAANQAKRRFISVVSHEMRTPLNAIVGMSDLLRESSLNPEQADMLQTMSASSRILLGLVEDVLDFSKIESGKLNVESVEFDLHALVNSTCRIIQAQVQAKGLDLLPSIMPEVPPALLGDPHHLRQVLINLVGNAVKFTERGSVTVHVSLLAETEEAIRIKFSVRDTGIGISPDAQSRIFDSFVQADQSTTRRFGGTGLGTTIAKQLVELMGGKMGLESAVGLGSTFWFEIELKKQPASDLAVSGELTGSRVLLVGFPASEREIVVKMLHGWGGTAVVFETAEEAIRRILTDSGLSKALHSVLLFAEDPVSSLRAMATLQRKAPLPVVLCVAEGFSQDTSQISRKGYSATLKMPIQKRLLFNVLHSVTASEEDVVSSSVVQLRDYFKQSQNYHYRIIVADDSATNRQVIGKILERGGHTVTLVDDGEDVLDALETAEFDLVILDRNMPGMGGVETLRALRLMTLGRDNLPVIILSADVTAETREECMEAGAEVFLPKPIEAIRLLDSVGELCGGSAVKTDRGHAPVDFVVPAVAVAKELNLETLQLLEGLGSETGFLERLIKVFVSDNMQLLEGIQRAVIGRDFVEFRRLLHAMKGSAASIGAERLAQTCSAMNLRSDAELGLQTKQLAGSIRQEFDAARVALDHYIENKRRTR